MTYSVLVVDDSSFFRRHLTDIINESPDLQVIGDAANGKEAVEKAASLRPDIITMDYEMPMMNGVVAVKQIMANNPTSILMLSSLTFEGARITLDAMDAGALDFLPKKFDEISRHTESVKNEIHSRILSIVRSAKSAVARTSNEKSTPKENRSMNDASRVSKPKTFSSALDQVQEIDCDLVILGASTGGPAAIATILNKIPADFHLPIVVVQHMPESFTPEFARRLDHQLAIRVKHAEEGDKLIPGRVLIAPGGMQTMFLRSSPARIHLTAGDERVSYKPSLNITFASAANVVGKRVLAVVLTGMGSDGMEGARLLKKEGAQVWAQDEASALIYGMPECVVSAGLCDLEVPLKEVAPCLLKATSFKPTTS